VGAYDPAQIKLDRARTEKRRRARFYVAPIGQPTVTEAAPQAERMRELG
jgi:hypothetical protein